MTTRASMWEKLRATNDPFDLLVIGGGVTGCGIARDAARRGLRVALVEQRDLAYGTSSRSSKLVHGGLRYLEMGELSLVFEAVSERRILTDIAPHLVNPQGFLFPVFNNSRRKRWVVNGGIWVYDALSLFRSPKLHQNLDAAQVAKEEPCLTLENLDGAPLYYDCATDDARLTLETALDALNSQAIIATYVKVTALVNGPDGRVQGAEIVDSKTGETIVVRAHAVVNATGPWTDRTLKMSKGHQGTLLRPTKGVHIVVSRKKLPLRQAVVCFHPKDGRVLFALPWGDRTYCGTTDTDDKADPGEIYADGSDVRYLLDACNAYFPRNPITADDVISTWAGLRPLVAPEGGAKGESQVSREHTVHVGADGLVTIAGGKLTTYRRMAAQVVDTVTNLLRLQNKLPSGLVGARTDTEPLPGAVGWPADDDHEKVADLVSEASGEKLSERTSLLLASTYGMRGIDLARAVQADPELGTPIIEGRPEITAQLVWAVEKELANSVSDVMIRRTQLYYRDVAQGLSAVDAVAKRMGEHLGWDAATRAEKAQEYREEVAKSRKWRKELGVDADKAVVD